MCVFCGGDSPATTIDHVPHRAIFLGRRRPAGLEFAACNQCNGGFADTDIVAALMSRISVGTDTEEDRGELGPLFRQAERRVPGLLADLRPAFGRRAREIVQPGETHQVVEIGEIVREHLRAFGAKLVLGLHHARTGRIVSNGGAIAAHIFTNADWITGRMPSELTGWSREPRTLVQGRQAVGDQFSYDWAAEADGSVALYIAVFRNSFAVAGFVADDANSVSDLQAAKEGVLLSPKEVQGLGIRLRDDARLRRSWKAQTVKFGGATSATLGNSLSAESGHPREASAR
jgi:hypothetical protein